MSQVHEPDVALKDALAGLYASILPELSQVESALVDELGSDYPLVDDIIRHGIRLGGKRLRPALVLLSGQGTGALTDAHITLAAVVEMIHTATLVHDDVLDEATLRRHTETVNARWNNETSVLLGDFLFTHAFYLASTMDSTFACRTIGRATNTVCEGELFQTASAGNVELSEDHYFKIIDAKTAALCACCCRLGSHYAGASQSTVERLSRFGRDLGIAFQISDDLLDVEGSESRTGKSLGTDLAKCKMTLPLIHARDTLPTVERRRFLNSLMAGGDVANGDLMDVLESAGSIEYAREQARIYADRAVEEMSELPASPARDALESMAAFVVARHA